MLNRPERKTSQEFVPYHTHEKHYVLVLPHSKHYWLLLPPQSVQTHRGPIHSTNRFESLKPLYGDLKQTKADQGGPSQTMTEKSVPKKFQKLSQKMSQKVSLKVLQKFYPEKITCSLLYEAVWGIFDFRVFSGASQAVEAATLYE